MKDTEQKKKYKIISLIGKAGSGKDTILNWVVSRRPDLHKIITFTTRPPRNNEIDGRDYYFKNKDNWANENIIDGTCQIFNDWVYGTYESALSTDEWNIGVFNFKANEKMYMNPNIDLYTIYIDANDKVRLLRQLNRKIHPDCEEIIRRFQADKNDEKNCTIHPELTIKNNDDFEVAYNAAPLIDYIDFIMKDPIWVE